MATNQGAGLGRVAERYAKNTRNLIPCSGELSNTEIRIPTWTQQILIALVSTWVLSLTSAEGIRNDAKISSIYTFRYYDFQYEQVKIHIFVHALLASTGTSASGMLREPFKPLPLQRFASRTTWTPKFCVKATFIIQNSERYLAD